MEKQHDIQRQTNAYGVYNAGTMKAKKIVGVKKVGKEKDEEN